MGSYPPQQPQGYIPPLPPGTTPQPPYGVPPCVPPPYGQQQYGQPPYQPPPYYLPPRWNGLAIAGFITSLFSILLVGIVGFILSLVGLIQINNSHGAQRGRGLAIAGIAIGACGIVFWILVLIGATTS